MFFIGILYYYVVCLMPSLGLRLSSFIFIIFVLKLLMLKVLYNFTLGHKGSSINASLNQKQILFIAIQTFNFRIMYWIIGIGKNTNHLG